MGNVPTGDMQSEQQQQAAFNRQTELLRLKAVGALEAIEQHRQSAVGRVITPVRRARLYAANLDQINYWLTDLDSGEPNIVFRFEITQALQNANKLADGEIADMLPPRFSSFIRTQKDKQGQGVVLQVNVHHIEHILDGCNRWNASLMEHVWRIQKMLFSVNTQVVDLTYRPNQIAVEQVSWIHKSLELAADEIDKALPVEIGTVLQQMGKVAWGTMVADTKTGAIAVAGIDAVERQFVDACHNTFNFVNGDAYDHLLSYEVLGCYYDGWFTGAENDKIIKSTDEKNYVSIVKYYCTSNAIFRALSWLESTGVMRDKMRGLYIENPLRLLQWMDSLFASITAVSTIAHRRKHLLPEAKEYRSVWATFDTTTFDEFKSMQLPVRLRQLERTFQPLLQQAIRAKDEIPFGRIVHRYIIYLQTLLLNALMPSVAALYEFTVESVTESMRKCLALEDAIIRKGAADKEKAEQMYYSAVYRPKTAAIEEIFPVVGQSSSMSFKHEVVNDEWQDTVVKRDGDADSSTVTPTTTANTTTTTTTTTTLETFTTPTAPVVVASPHSVFSPYIFHASLVADVINALRDS